MKSLFFTALVLPLAIFVSESAHSQVGDLIDQDGKIYDLKKVERYLTIDPKTSDQGVAFIVCRDMIKADGKTTEKKCTLQSDPPEYMDCRIKNGKAIPVREKGIELQPSYHATIQKFPSSFSGVTYVVCDRGEEEPDLRCHLSKTPPNFISCSKNSQDKDPDLGSSESKKSQGKKAQKPAAHHSVSPNGGSH